jgi:ketopantoate hydroxymethyltransferase
MPSNVLDDLFVSRVAAHSRTLDHAGAQTVFVNAVVAGMETAITAGTYTATIAIGATTTDIVQWVMEQLRQNGFDVSISTTNLVVSWA